MSTIAVDSARPSAGGTSYSLTQGVTKAWVNFNGTGTVAIRDSLNVGSITDVGTGRYDISYSSSFSQADYSVFLGGRKSDSNDDGNFAATCGNTTRVPTASDTPITTVYVNSISLQDFPQVNLSSFGDLA